MRRLAGGGLFYSTCVTRLPSKILDGLFNKLPFSADKYWPDYSNIAHSGEHVGRNIHHIPILQQAPFTFARVALPALLIVILTLHLQFMCPQLGPLVVVVLRMSSSYSIKK